MGSTKNYDPFPALVNAIPKPAGGTRQISVYPVPDAAVANYYYLRILKRNQSRLSPYSYGYRRDIGIQDAIERLWREFHEQSHYFVVEYDFSKYFDTISHSYLKTVLSGHFKLTRTEQYVVGAMLSSRRAFGRQAYEAQSWSRCTRGIPQGNSLSLFLANAACHELDLEMSRRGLLFARYADDIAVFCRDLDSARESRELIMDHCLRAGLSVNYVKSPGISEVGPQGLKKESQAKPAFEFLGHRMSYELICKSGSPAPMPVRRLSIRPRTIARMRQKLANIVYVHLLRYPSRGYFSATRVDATIGVDWDLVKCINDLRGYMYGGMPESELSAALADRTRPLHRPRGMMAFFPLINDVDQLRAVDGWLLGALSSALTQRLDLITNIVPSLIGHYPELSREELEAGDWYPADISINNDVRIPSLVRAWKYSRRCLFAFGLRQYPERVPTEPESLYR